MSRVRWDRSKGRPEPIRALDRMPERENGEPLVDMRIECPSIRVLRPAIVPWCRLQVARMAEQAARSLPEGVFLGLIEAWRPIERQQRIYDFMWEAAREVYPERDFAALRRTVNRLVAPTNGKAPPGHCTGAALDVWLVDAEGEVLDVTSPFQRFGASRTYTLGLSDIALANRTLLVEAMLDAGFSNCRDEWWHYSYGDAGWAVRTGASECFYGLVSLPRHLYEEEEALHIEGMKERTNPFLS